MIDLCSFAYLFPNFQVEFLLGIFFHHVLDLLWRDRLSTESLELQIRALNWLQRRLLRRGYCRRRVLSKVVSHLLLSFWVVSLRSAFDSQYSVVRCYGSVLKCATLYSLNAAGLLVHDLYPLNHSLLLHIFDLNFRRCLNELFWRRLIGGVKQMEWWARQAAIWFDGTNVLRQLLAARRKCLNVKKLVAALSVFVLDWLLCISYIYQDLFH